MMRAALLALLLASPPALAAQAELLAIPDPLHRPEVAPPPKTAEQLRREEEEKNRPRPPSDEEIAEMQALRRITVDLANWARQFNPNFAIFARGALHLLNSGGGDLSSMERALTGVVVDGLYCEAPQRRTAVLEQLRSFRGSGRLVLSIDVCPSSRHAAVLKQAAADGVILYLAPNRRIDSVPPRPPGENPDNILSPMQARNVAFVLGARGVSSAGQWTAALQAGNHDMVIIDPFLPSGEALSAEEVRTLRYKRIGSRRLAVAVMPMAIAEDHHFYWRPEWNRVRPAFIEAPVPHRQGAYFVRADHPEWKRLLGVYIKGLIELGFDGVMFDDYGDPEHGGAMQNR